LLQTEVNVAHKKLIVLWCSYRQYYRRKANTIKLYGKIFTPEIDIQQAKFDFYYVHKLCSQSGTFIHCMKRFQTNHCGSFMKL